MQVSGHRPTISQAPMMQQNAATFVQRSNILAKPSTPEVAETLKGMTADPQRRALGELITNLLQQFFGKPSGSDVAGANPAAAVGAAQGAEAAGATSAVDASKPPSAPASVAAPKRKRRKRRGFFRKIGSGLKKFAGKAAGVLAKAGPIAKIAASFIPGVGPAIAAGIGVAQAGLGAISTGKLSWGTALSAVTSAIPGLGAGGSLASRMIGQVTSNPLAQRVLEQGLGLASKVVQGGRLTWQDAMGAFSSMLPQGAAQNLQTPMAIGKLVAEGRMSAGQVGEVLGMLIDRSGLSTQESGQLRHALAFVTDAVTAGRLQPEQAASWLSLILTQPSTGGATA